MATGAGAPVAAGAAPADPPLQSGMGGRAAHVCGTFVHSLILSLGLVFFLQVASIGVTLNSQGTWSEPGVATNSLQDALIMLLKNFLHPFMEASFLDHLIPDSSGIDVWGFWVPGLLSLFLLTIAYLGLSTIRWRRPSRAVPYAFLAAVFLVWQVQVGQALMEISTWEDLAGKSTSSTAPKKVQQYLFKGAHDAFEKMYTEQQCKAMPGQKQKQMKCSAESTEAKLIPFIVQEFCRPRSEGLRAGFDARAQTCRETGRKLRLLPARPQDSDAFYCQCWAAVFDAMKTFARWIMVIWFGLLAGVLSVLYVAAEPKLARMYPKERREVLCFAFVSMALLSLRVTLLPEGLPWQGTGIVDE